MSLPRFGYRFADVCGALGYSLRHGYRLLAEGRFPIPYLPRVSRRASYRFSTADIDRYRETAATADVKPRLHRLLAGGR